MSVNEIQSNKTYTDLYGDHLDNVVVFGNPDIATEFQVHVKVELWGENYISLHERGVKGEPVLQDDIIVLDLPERKLEWFKGDRPKWGSVHWRETLKQKPVTNKWILDIVDGDEFTYAYQTPFADILPSIPGAHLEYLTEDNVECVRLVYPPGSPGIYEQRPLDVDGSIAIYHKTKANHIIGQKNYRTGKALHVPRPKAIDDNGDWVWCDIRVKDHVYIRTIPQNFLDNAVYPVIINDTFGYSDTPLTTHNCNDDYMICNGPFSPASDGTATSISVYSKSQSVTPSEHTFGIWDDNAGSPGNLAKDTAGVSVTTSYAWRDEPLDSSLAVYAANSYHLGLNGDDNLAWAFDVDSFTEDIWYEAQTYSSGTLANFTAGSTLWFLNRRYGAFVTYTEAAAGAAGIMTTNTGYWGATY